MHSCSGTDTQGEVCVYQHVSELSKFKSQDQLENMIEESVREHDYFSTNRVPKDPITRREQIWREGMILTYLLQFSNQVSKDS